MFSYFQFSHQALHKTGTMKSEASYNSRSKSNYNFQVKKSKDEMTGELEEKQIDEPVVDNVPQSSLGSDADESGEPEEDSEEDPAGEPEEGSEEDPAGEPEEVSEADPAEDPEEDPDEDTEEDPEEESSVETREESVDEPSKCVLPVLSYRKYDETKQPVENPSKYFASELSSQNETYGIDHQSGSNYNNSKEKKRRPDATKPDSDQLEDFQSQKKFRLEEAFKEEQYDDLHGKSVVSEALLNDQSAASQQEHTGSSGKRRRSRWEPQPEQDVETSEGIEANKRRKTRWTSDVSKIKMLGPIQLPDFVRGFLECELDPVIQKLKARLSVINNKLLSLECHHDTGRVKLQKRLVRERQSIISKLIKMNLTFQTPPDYKQLKLFKKLYIPVREYPTYNFVGLIMGPRGNTQKRMEQETGARILLRGKDSARKKPETSDDDEDLHVYIEADNQKSLDAAVTMVEKLLIPIDEGMNEHKRAQLEELAILNGTYTCRVCKEEGHKYYACPRQRSTFRMGITCATCGSFCHPTSSCPLIASPEVGNSSCNSSALRDVSIPNTKSKHNKDSSEANLYVGHLPQAVDENWLRELFCPFGKIVEVRVIKDQITGFSKGYGFVKFEDPIYASMAVTHMNGHKMEGKTLAVRVAGRPPVAGLSAMSCLPKYPGAAAIAANAPRQTAWPGPPGSALPEAQASFPKNPDLLSSSISLGHDHLPERKATYILPSAVSSYSGSVCSSSFDSIYRYPHQTQFSSPALLSEFPGDPNYRSSQPFSYFSTPMLKPSPPFHFNQAPEGT